MKTLPLFLGAAFLLAACEPVNDDATGSDTAFIAELPEPVRAIAATNQNLEAVAVDPVDNCYVYQHRNAVETTLLPLRTREGRPICIQKPESAPEET